MRPRSRSAGFLMRQVGDQLVAFDQVQQRLHVLSQTAAVTWRHCDGRSDLSGLADLVCRELGIPIDEGLITLALQQLDEARLLEERLIPAPSESGVSRREILHWAGVAAAGFFLPTITSCGSPLGPDRTPGAAASSRIDIVLATTTVPTSTTTPFQTTTVPTSTTTPFQTTTTSTTTSPPTTTTSTTSTTTTTSTTSPPTTTTTTTPAPRKVQLCHKGKSIMVDESAVAMHLAHGDTLGPCP